MLLPLDSTLPKAPRRSDAGPPGRGGPVARGRRWDAKAAKDSPPPTASGAELAAAGWSMLDGKDGYGLEPMKKA